MNGQRCSRIVRALVAIAIVVLVFAPVVRADEIWVAASSQQDLGGLEIASNTFWPVTPIGVVRLVWAVPNNLQTFQSAKVALIPSSPAGAATLNVLVCAAQNGNPVSGTCAGPFPQAFTGVANQLVEVEIGPAIASRVGTAGQNYVAVLAYTTPTTTTDHIVGLRFGYVPTPPSGVATLGANTFTGTQTATSFVGSFTGNGSGLTNLPVPSGAATLGSNTFTGTQTAPAFVGDGSGLTNLPPGPPGPPGTTGQGVALNFNSTGGAFLNAGENVLANATLTGGSDVFYTVSFGASFGNVSGAACTVELYVIKNNFQHITESLVTLPPPVPGVVNGWGNASGNIVVLGNDTSQQLKLIAFPTGCPSAVWEFPYLNILTLKK